VSLQNSVHLNKVLYLHEIYTSKGVYPSRNYHHKTMFNFDADNYDIMILAICTIMSCKQSDLIGDLKLASSQALR